MGGVKSSPLSSLQTFTAFPTILCLNKTASPLNRRVTQPWVLRTRGLMLVQCLLFEPFEFEANEIYLKLNAQKPGVI